MIPLPHPFMVIPGDGSDPVYIHDRPDWHPPMLAVALVTPYVAQKWLHAGEAEFRPVVMVDHERQILAGRGIVEAAARGEGGTAAAVNMVAVDTEVAETAWTAVQAMRRAFELPETTDVPALVLSEDGGQVLGGAEALYDLRKPAVFIVLVTLPGVAGLNADGRYN